MLHATIEKKLHAERADVVCGLFFLVLKNSLSHLLAFYTKVSV
jgi:hypothetical protein